MIFTIVLEPVYVLAPLAALVLAYLVKMARL